MPPADAIRLFHFADVHLGVETYGKYNPETGLNTRLEDFTAALHEAIDRALSAEVDLAVFAGDAYKARDPNQTHQRAFAGALKRLVDAGIPVALLVGNHDIPNTRGRAHALEIYGLLASGTGAGVTVLQRPEVVSIPTRRGAVQVAGMPYLVRSNVLTQEEAKGKSVEEIAHLIRDRYVGYLAFLAEEASRQPDHLTILAGHFTVADARVGVQGFLLNPNEPQVPVGALALPAFDYVALGHVHKPQELNRGAQPPVVYSGSIDRIDFGERAESKGFVLADIRKGEAQWKPVALPTRPFVEIEADVRAADDPTAALLAQIARHPIADSIVRVRYQVDSERLALLRTDEIRRALAPAHVVVALTRDLPSADTPTRSQAVTEQLTPEVALAHYIDLHPRLLTRKEELMTAGRALLDQLAQEEAL